MGTERALSHKHTALSFTREELCSIRDENNARNTNLPALINQISDALQKQPRIPFAFPGVDLFSQCPFLTHTGPPGRLLNGDAWVQIAPVQKGSGVCPTVRPGVDITFHLYQFYDGSVPQFSSNKSKIVQHSLSSKAISTRKTHNQHDLLTPFRI